MSDISALQALKNLYDLQATAFQNFNQSCTPGCTFCCTRNVVMTSLEGDYLLGGMGQEEINRLLAAFSHKPTLLRMQPSLTLNAMAALYMAGEDPPEDPADPSWWPCPILDEKTGKCGAYAHRPMACRCMISKTPCETSGLADMEEEAILLHTLFLQAVEHLDIGGKSANLMDLLMEILKPGSTDVSMPENRKIPMLMIPQSSQEKLRPLLGEIGKILGSVQKTEPRIQ